MILAALIFLFLYAHPTSQTIALALLALPDRQIGQPSPEPVTVLASWYGEADRECLGCSAARLMANGERFDEGAFTAACADRWPLGAALRLSSGPGSVDIVCTDRGGFEAGYGRSLDLTKAAFAALAPLENGVIKVRVTVL